MYTRIYVLTYICIHVHMYWDNKIRKLFAVWLKLFNMLYCASQSPMNEPIMREEAWLTSKWFWNRNPTLGGQYAETVMRRRLVFECPLLPQSISRYLKGPHIYNVTFFRNCIMTTLMFRKKKVCGLIGAPITWIWWMLYTIETFMFHICKHMYSQM